MQSSLMAPVFPFSQRHKRLMQLFVAQTASVRYRWKFFTCECESVYKCKCKCKYHCKCNGIIVSHANRVNFLQPCNSAISPHLRHPLHTHGTLGNLAIRQSGVTAASSWLAFTHTSNKSRRCTSHCRPSVRPSDRPSVRPSVRSIHRFAR